MEATQCVCENQAATLTLQKTIQVLEEDVTYTVVSADEGLNEFIFTCIARGCVVATKTIATWDTRKVDHFFVSSERKAWSFISGRKRVDHMKWWFAEYYGFTESEQPCVDYTGRSPIGS